MVKTTNQHIVGLPISNKQTPFLWGRVLGGRVKYTADRPRDDRDTEEMFVLSKAP